MVKPGKHLHRNSQKFAGKDGDAGNIFMEYQHMIPWPYGIPSGYLTTRKMLVFYG